jgi:hypothetical protein
MNAHQGLSSVGYRNPKSELRGFLQKVDNEPCRVAPCLTALKLAWFSSEEQGDHHDDTKTKIRHLPKFRKRGLLADKRIC